MIGDTRDTNDPAAVLFPEIPATLESAEEPHILTGRSRDNHSIWQVTGAAPLTSAASVQSSESHDKLIGMYIPETEGININEEMGSVDSDVEIPFGLTDHPYLLLTESGGEFDASIRGLPDPFSIEVEEVELDRLMIRVEDGPTPLGQLRHKKVAIVGVGSGGALVADYLAKSGVQDLVLIDDDLFETHNIVRHVCGMKALGRHKVDAVASHLNERLPNIDITRIRSKFELESANDIERFVTVLEDVDLIVSASADHSTNNLLDTFVHDHLPEPVPVVYAGMFDGLDGGIIIRVDQQVNDRCYHCIYSGFEKGGRANASDDSEDKKLAAPRPQPADADVPYDRDTEEEASVPGLGIDVDNLSVFVAKMCLYTLLRETDHGLFEMDQGVYTWANRDMVRASFHPDDPMSKLFGLEMAYVPKDRLPQREDCPYCG